MNPAGFFNAVEKGKILSAIRDAEMNTSGEIRLHLEADCKTDVLDRAAYIFEKLGMYKTNQRNGVLIYLAVNDRKFAILGDAGINAVVPPDFWDQIKKTMEEYFKQNDFAEGLSKAIQMAGLQLKKHFPHQKDDVNELSDEISYGNK
ncbi:MAG: TPM domain-containing protein [Bacteroidales bacterium]|nr:TPM domain-containing protein [Bacteroidales bacterium]